MIYPALRELMEKAGSRYSLVIATAKRARELVDGNAPLVDIRTKKPVSVAVSEIYEDKILVGRGDEIETDADAETEVDFSEYVMPSYVVDEAGQHA